MFIIKFYATGMGWVVRYWDMGYGGEHGEHVRRNKLISYEPLKILQWAREQKFLRLKLCTTRGVGVSEDGVLGERDGVGHGVQRNKLISPKPFGILK